MNVKKAGHARPAFVVDLMTCRQTAMQMYFISR